MCGPIVLPNWSVTLIAQLVPSYGLYSSTRTGTSLHSSDQAVKVNYAGGPMVGSGRLQEPGPCCRQGWYTDRNGSRVNQNGLYLSEATMTTTGWVG